MKVKELMTPAPRTCTPDGTLAAAAAAMANQACGVLPVVKAGRIVGMITDRDVCLALARKDRKASEMRVEEAMTEAVHYVGEDDTLARALQLMRRWRVRRLPVLATDGRLRGILTVNDLVLKATPSGNDGPSWSDLVRTLQAICERQRPVPPPPPRKAPVEIPIRY